MEPHLQHTQGHHYDDPNTINAGAGAATLHTGNDEDVHHGEKKSVMKKVKERAKKLKNTITKSKHGHGHGGDDHHDDDDDDDDDEMEENPEVHGAPVYDSAKLGLARDSLERPSAKAEDRYGRSDVAEPEAKHGAPPPVSTGPYGTNLSEPSGLGHPHGQEVSPKQWRGKIGQSTGMEEDPFNPVVSRTHQEESRGSIGKPTGMVKDPNDSKDPSLAGSDPSNYETKVSDPTRTGTTHQEKLRGSMGKSTGMFQDPNDPKDPSLAGSDPNDPKDRSLAGSDPSNYETKVSDPTHRGTTHQEELRGSIGKPTGMVKDPNDSKDPSLAGSDPSNYETKVSDPTRTGTTHQEKLRGSMGKSTGMFQDPNDPKDPSLAGSDPNDPKDPSLAGSDPSNYETKVSDPTHTGTTHLEELRGSMGKSTGMVKDPNDPKDPSLAGSDPSNYETKVSDPTHTGGKVAGLSQKFDKMGIHESDPKSFDPNHPENQPRETLTGNPSSRSSSYVEKISSSASAIVDKATDVVTSKLGYSGKVPSNEPHETATKPHETATKPVSVTGKVTETLAPVYSKVVDAGSSVISKVQGSVSKRPPVEGATTTVEKGKEGDKGATVKEYVVETLRPGDDDKALSEVITNAFHRGKHEETEKKAGEDIPAPVGTVTESEAVRQQLESDPDHDHDHDHSNNVVAGRGVADRLKDAVGSWFGGKGNAPEGTGGGTSYVTDEGLSSTKPTPTENRDGGK